MFKKILKSQDDAAKWAKIESSSHPGDFQTFISHYPHSPLVENAKQRLTALQRIAADNTAPKAIESGSPAYSSASIQPHTAVPSGTAKIPSAENRVDQDKNAGQGTELTMLEPSTIARPLRLVFGGPTCLGGDKGFGSIGPLKLRQEHARVCPLQCGQGETARGDTCVVTKSPKQNETARRKEEEPRHKSKETHRKPLKLDEQRSSRRAERSVGPPRPHVRAEVSAEHESHGGGGGGTTTGFGY